VLICDDQEVMRAGLRMVVESQPALTVVGEAGDGEAAVAQALTLRPDLVLMEARPPCRCVPRCQGHMRWSSTSSRA
jgi:DNA-binding NarL/FixJ family response regulator